MKTIKILVLGLVLSASALTVNAQKWGNSPDDSVNCVINQSLYAEFYKQGNYIDAYTPWKELYKTCPASSKNIYIRGVNILKAKINAAKTAEERDTLINELMGLYDMRTQYFGDEATNLAKKAFDLEQLRRDAVAEYYGYYEQAVKKGMENLDVTYIYKFYEATLNYAKTGGDPMLVIDNYDIVTDLLEKAAIAHPEKAEDINKYMNNVEAGFSPYATCEQLVNIYSKKFEATPDDTVLLKKITALLQKKNCTGEELFFKASERLHALIPSPETALLMGQMCYNNKRYGDAVKYLNEAIKGLTEAKDKYNAYKVIGLAYTEQRSYSAARNAYYEAASINPTKGEPYILIAQLYASSAGSIDDGMGGRSAYWAAADKAAKARSVDSSPENVEKANKLIGQYSARFPKKETAFDYDIIDGQSYRVGGWIGETTTVRTR